MIEEPQSSGSVPLAEQALHLRLSVVESDNARLRRNLMLVSIGLAGAAALAVAGLVMARAAVSGGVQEASAYVLRDETGIERGAWRIQETGASTLMLNDRNGIGRVRASVLADGAPGIALADSRGRSRIVVSLQADLTGTVVFADAEGNTRAVLGLSDDGSATVVFADRFGQTRAAMGVDAEGDPVISVLENGRAAADTSGAGRR